MSMNSKHLESARKLNRKLGKILKARRILKGLSQDQLAMGSKLSLNFVIKTEEGRGRLTMDDLMKLNKVLKYKTLADLFEEAGL